MANDPVAADGKKQKVSAWVKYGSAGALLTAVLFPGNPGKDARDWIRECTLKYEQCRVARVHYRDVERAVEPPRTSCVLDWASQASKLKPARTMAECETIRADGGICVVSDDVDDTAAKGLLPLRNEMWRKAYLPANPKFGALFAESVGSEAPTVGQRIVVVSAPAGSGKSWVVRGAYSERDKTNEGKTRHLNGGSEQSIIRFDDLTRWVTGSTPDLNGRVANEDLRTTLKGSSATLQQELDALFASVASDPSSVWVVDSMDEVHPRVRESFNGRLGSAFVGRPRLHVYLFGRPESLAAGLKDEDQEGIPKVRVELAQPAVQTTEALAMRWNNYVLWRLAEHGVSIDKNARIEDVARFLTSSRTVCSSFGQLAVGGFVIGDATLWRQTNAGTLTEEGLQRLMLEELLRRNRETHDRPSEGSSVYVSLLEKVAARGVVQWSLGGKFKPAFEAPMPGAPSGWQLLDHSGLVNLDPLDNRTYSFQPWWVPLELIRRHNARLNDEDQGRQCSLEPSVVDRIRDPIVRRSREFLDWCDKAVDSLAVVGSSAANPP